MARLDLDTNSAFASILATPAMNGDSFVERTAAVNDPAATSAIFLSIIRIPGCASTGRAIFSPASAVTMGQIGPSSAGDDRATSAIYLGLAVASHSTNAPTTARFIAYQTTPANAVVTPSPILTNLRALQPQHRDGHFEVHGNRPRAPTATRESLELYNSAPWFQDISRYR